jgi:hypothetical protein
MSNQMLKTIEDRCRGECPNCKSTNLDYDDVQFDGDDLMWFPFICDDCEAYGHEDYSVNYISSEVDVEVEG